MAETRRPTMRKFGVLVVVLPLILSGCIPMSLFAKGSGGDYDRYSSSWGTKVASNKVNTICLTPTLRLAIMDIEGHFGRKVVMNSGYRTPAYNSEVGGAHESYHKKCMAADFFIPGVPKSQLIAYARQMSLVGGLGCYPGRSFVHIDVRSRPWGSKGPVTFAGC